MKKLVLTLCFALAALCSCSKTENTKESTPTPTVAQDSSPKKEQNTQPAENDDKQNTPATTNQDTQPVTEAAPKEVSEKSIDEIIEMLNKEGLFSTELEQLPKEAIPNFFNIENAVDYCAFFGTGGTADSFGIFQFEEGSSKSETLESILTYVSEARENAILYAPEEVSKYDSIIVKTSDTMLLFCIATDVEKAGSIINSVFK